MSRTYDENMPIAELMRKINSGEIKKFKSVRPRYYDENIPIAELMRKINSGEIEKVRPYKPVRPRRKLIIVDDVKRYRFQDDVWKTILEYLLSPASRVMVKLRTANAMWLRVVFAKCGHSGLLSCKWTKARHIKTIIETVKKPFGHHDWFEANADASRLLCDKIMAEDFSVKVTQRDVDSYQYRSVLLVRDYKYLYDFEEEYKDYLPTKLTGRARERALEYRARELADRERGEIEYYRGL
jgi:hypothetical protein